MWFFSWRVPGTSVSSEEWDSATPQRRGFSQAPPRRISPPVSPGSKPPTSPSLSGSSIAISWKPPFPKIGRKAPFSWVIKGKKGNFFRAFASGTVKLIWDNSPPSMFRIRRRTGWVFRDALPPKGRSTNFSSGSILPRSRNAFLSGKMPWRSGTFPRDPSSGDGTSSSPAVPFPKLPFSSKETPMVRSVPTDEPPRRDGAVHSHGHRHRRRHHHRQRHPHRRQPRP